ncbi:MAG: acyl-CoA dehydrogenase, partial [Polaromonas sp.]|nr:acyl-CoA dehydrogenase [Polaromonas sp.]
DARITMVYEGTNEIQAIDLLVRKVLADQGQALHGLVAELLADLATTTPATVGTSAAATTHMAADLLTRLGQAATALCQRHTTAPEHAYWVAGDFLRATALALMAWGWARIGHTDGADTPRWLQPAQALRAWVLPEFEQRMALLVAHHTAETA